jgi:disulfide bond formation protein DsbB
MPADAAQHDSYAFAYAAWVTAMVATLGSVFFGEVMQLPSCTLCWYQRICLFPLTVILAVGIVLRDTRLTHYALPLVLAGLALAAYHNLIYYGIVSEELSPCTHGVPCSTRQIEWMGFVTIPLMAFFGFLSILICLLVHRHRLGRART